FQGAAAGKLNIQAALLDKLPRGHRQFFTLRDQDQKPLGEQMLDANRAIFTAEDHRAVDRRIHCLRRPAQYSLLGDREALAANLRVWPDPRLWLRLGAP